MAIPTTEDIGSRILYEDNHLIIINKKAKEIVQGDKTGDTPLVEKVRAYLKETYNKPGNVFCGLVHRIDRPVSGVVIFAKTSKALSRMNEMIRDHKVHKTYRAIIEKSTISGKGKLTGYITKNEKQNKSYYSLTSKEGYQKAELLYEVIGQTERYTLLEVELITGRHHQIRTQLSAHFAPIKGDLKYGAKRSNVDGSISLHAYKIEFEHPVSHQNITVTAKVLQEEFCKIWDKQ